MLIIFDGMVFWNGKYHSEFWRMILVDKPSQHKRRLFQAETNAHMRQIETKAKWDFHNNRQHDN